MQRSGQKYMSTEYKAWLSSCVCVVCLMIWSLRASFACSQTDYSNFGRKCSAVGRAGSDTAKLWADKKNRGKLFEDYMKATAPSRLASCRLCDVPCHALCTCICSSCIGWEGHGRVGDQNHPQNENAAT